MKRFFWLCVSASLLCAQQIDVRRAEAEEEFRWGVQSYHSAQYGEAILSFSRALSLDPDYLQARGWLADAYLSQGFRDAALDEWKTVNAVERSVIRSYLIEFFSLQQSRLLEPSIADTYYEAASVEGRQGDTKFFFRPAMIRSRKDGTFYLVSMATNEILHINAGGVLLNRLAGGLATLTQPFDVVEHEGTLFVSEFGANRISRISLEGSTLSSFGSLGNGSGEFIGPQYLAVDDGGYLYVSDYGNKRISKFDSDGGFVLHFGQRTAAFPGLKRPRGIASVGDSLFVADELKIEEFDSDGNHLASYPSPSEQGEALQYLEDGIFLLSSPERVVMFDLKRNIEISSFADERALHLLGVDRDVNGTILVSDNERDSLHYFFPYSQLNSGFFLWIEKIRFSEFPRVLVELNVRDWDGNPMSGLDRQNFFLLEENVPVSDFTLSSSHDVQQGSDVVVLVESSLNLRSQSTVLNDAVNTVKEEIRSFQDATSLFHIVAAGSQPVVLSTTNSSRIFNMDETLFDSAWNFEQGLHLAASSLLPGTGVRKSVVFLGDGKGLAIQSMNIERLALYLWQNRIRFDVVLLQNTDTPDARLAYLVEKTGGEVHFLYQPEGLRPLFHSISSTPSGYYTLEYVSDARHDFGRSYIALSVEAHYFARSGSIDSGYFAPLEF